MFKWNWPQYSRQQVSLAVPGARSHRPITGYLRIAGPALEMSTQIVPIEIVNWYTFYIGMYLFMWLFRCFTADFDIETRIKFWITDSLWAYSEIPVDSNHVRFINNICLNLESSKSSIPWSRFLFSSATNWVLLIWRHRGKASQNLQPQGLYM